MKRILRIIRQYRFRPLAVVMISVLLSSSQIILGNSLVNDSMTTQNNVQIATSFGFSMEKSDVESYLITAGLFDTDKVGACENEGNAPPEIRNFDEVYSVTFIVLNQEGLPIPDAAVLLSDGFIGSTDELGFVSLLLFDGIYQAQIVHPNYDVFTLDFNVAGADLFFEIILNSLGTGPLLITCPLNVEGPTSGGCFAIDLDLGEPLIQDNSPSYVLSNDAPPDGFPVGTTIVTWTVANEWGEIASCDQLVTVFDVEPPVLTPLPNITIDNEPGACGASASWDLPTASDNCEVETIVGSHAPGDFFPVGLTSVIYTATDVNGNTAYAGFTVEVMDVETPLTTPLPDIMADSEPGDCGASASWELPTASDNCEVETIAGSHAPGDFFSVGSTSVIYTATDVHGNAAYAGFTVQVIDVEPPVITPLPDIMIDNDIDECGASASWDLPTASDNCEVETIVGSHAPGDFFPAGSTSVIYTATDVHGNAAYSGFTVEVMDVEPPVITPLPDIIVQLNASGDASIVAADIDNGSYDACGIADLSVSPSTFTCADVGPNTVTLTATDNNGNTSFSTSTVTIEDNVAPTAICQNITIQLDASGAASIAAGDIDDGSSDACGIATLAIDITEFDCSHAGTNSVTLTVTDNNGNQSTCTATVTVNYSAACVDCEGVINGDALPGSLCFNGSDAGTYNADCECVSNDLGSINGHVDGLADCGLRNITISTYNDEFPNLNAVFSTTIDANGDFTTPAFSTGTYSILIKIDGYLAKLYADEIIDSGINPLLISDLIPGDINNSNNVNLGDVSALNASFGSMDGDLDYNHLADLNCDGLINVVDVSILNSAFGMVGDAPPINN